MQNYQLCEKWELFNNRNFPTYRFFIYDKIFK